MDLNPAWIALIGTVLGASGLKVIEHWLTRNKVKDDTAAEFRKELREEVTGLREELRKVREEVNATESDLDKWREKYYELLDNFIKVKAELDEAVRHAQGVDKPAPDVVESTEQAPTT